MKYQVTDLKLPAVLKGAENGRLPVSVLVDISGGGKLVSPAARAWEAMHAEAMSGVGTKPFKPTSSADAYRSFPQQLAGFIARFLDAPGPNTTTATRTHLGKKWYLKKGMAPMATPGTSNHGWGLAVDIWSANGQRLDWMMQNIAKFGWSWEVQSEPWHIRYVAGDAIPQAVLEFEAKKISPV